MAERVLMPKLGMTMAEGTIEEWKVREGDAVRRGQTLASVATDKLTGEVDAPRDGVVLRILAGEGETVPVSSAIAYIGEAGEAILNDGTAGGSILESMEGPRGETATEGKPIKAADRNIKAAPAARKLAEEHGIDLSLISGTGPKGRIKRADVEAFVTGQGGGAAPVRISPTAARVARDKGVDVGQIDVGDRRIMKDDVLRAVGGNGTVKVQDTTEDNDYPPARMDSLRRSIARNMTESWHVSPTVTYTHPADCTALMALRLTLRESFEAEGLKISYNHILIKMAAQVLMEFPDVNASVRGDQLVRHIHANVGLAVTKGNGLIVPNVKQAETKTLKEIAREVEGLIAATREGAIDMESIMGGTFTISNLGAYGITHFSPIINQPELAILGVCAIADTPTVRDGQVVIRPMMNLCLTADHRAVDGAMASKFLRRLAELVESPYLLLS